MVVPVVLRDVCDGCGDCIERCESDALSVRDRHITVDVERCSKCGNCIPACPEGAIAIDDGALTVDEERCTKSCRACFLSCPEDALTVDGVLVVDTGACEMCKECTATCPCDALVVPRKTRRFTWRRASQAAFLILFLWLAAGSADVWAYTDATAPAWLPGPWHALDCPFGSMQLYYLTGAWAALVALAVGFSLVASRAFCGWVCPIGTLVDVVDAAVDQPKGGVPRPLTVRYEVLAVALWAMVVFGYMAICSFCPVSYFYLTPDPRLALAAAVAVALLALALRRGFCTTICPMGALTALMSRFGLYRLVIRCDRVDRCNICRAVCDWGAVSRVGDDLEVSDECVLCMECELYCPHTEATVHVEGPWGRLWPAWSTRQGLRPDEDPSQSSD